jgi:hypothetical protein
VRNLPKPRKIVPTQKVRTSAVAENGSATVTTRLGTRASTRVDESRVDTLGRRVFEQNDAVARVEVGIGVTVNIGNFESLRVDVRVSVPCLPAEVDEAYQQASEKVEALVVEEQLRWVPSNSVVTRR